MVQRLRLRAFAAVSPGSTPGEGTKILKAAKVRLKINKLKKKKKKIISETQLLPHVIRRSGTGGKRAGGSEKSDPLGLKI